MSAKGKASQPKQNGSASKRGNKNNTKINSPNKSQSSSSTGQNKSPELQPSVAAASEEKQEEHNFNDDQEHTQDQIRAHVVDDVPKHPNSSRISEDELAKPKIGDFVQRLNQVRNLLKPYGVIAGEKAALDLDSENDSDDDMHVSTSTKKGLNLSDKGYHRDNFVHSSECERACPKCRALSADCHRLARGFSVLCNTLQDLMEAHGKLISTQRLTENSQQQKGKQLELQFQHQQQLLLEKVSERISQALQEDEDRVVRALTPLIEAVKVRPKELEHQEHDTPRRTSWLGLLVGLLIAVLLFRIAFLLGRGPPLVYEVVDPTYGSMSNNPSELSFA